MNKVENILIGPVPAPDSTLPLVALIFALIGSGLAVAGVFILFGIGWALIAAAIPTLSLAVFMVIGLKHGA